MPPEVEDILSFRSQICCFLAQKNHHGFFFLCVCVCGQFLFFVFLLVKMFFSLRDIVEKDIAWLQLLLSTVLLTANKIPMLSALCHFDKGTIYNRVQNAQCQVMSVVVVLLSWTLWGAPGMCTRTCTCTLQVQVHCIGWEDCVRDCFQLPRHVSSHTLSLDRVMSVKYSIQNFSYGLVSTGTITTIALTIDL